MTAMPEPLGETLDRYTKERTMPDLPIFYAALRAPENTYARIYAEDWDQAAFLAQDGLHGRVIQVFPRALTRDEAMERMFTGGEYAEVSLSEQDGRAVVTLTPNPATYTAHPDHQLDVWEGQTRDAIHLQEDYLRHIRPQHFLDLLLELRERRAQDAGEAPRV